MTESETESAANAKLEARARKAERRLKQRAANIGRAEKMQKARLTTTLSPDSEDTLPAINTHSPDELNHYSSPMPPMATRPAAMWIRRPDKLSLCGLAAEAFL